MMTRRSKPAVANSLSVPRIRKFPLLATLLAVNGAPIRGIDRVDKVASSIAVDSECDWMAIAASELLSVDTLVVLADCFPLGTVTIDGRDPATE